MARSEHVNWTRRTLKKSAAKCTRCEVEQYFTGTGCQCGKEKEISCRLRVTGETVKKGDRVAGNCSVSTSMQAKNMEIWHVFRAPWDWSSRQQGQN